MLLSKLLGQLNLQTCTMCRNATNENVQLLGWLSLKNTTQKVTVLEFDERFCPNSSDNLIYTHAQCQERKQTKMSNSSDDWEITKDWFHSKIKTKPWSSSAWVIFYRGKQNTYERRGYGYRPTSRSKAPVTDLLPPWRIRPRRGRCGRLAFRVLTALRDSCPGLLQCR